MFDVVVDNMIGFVVDVFEVGDEEEDEEDDEAEDVLVWATFWILLFACTLCVILVDFKFDVDDDKDDDAFGWIELINECLVSWITIVLPIKPVLLL